MKDSAIARKMGCAIAQLHRAFLKCEKEVDFWDNSLLQEMQGWVQETLADNEWLENVKSVIAGYESIIPLSAKEKSAIPCVMECIEILFTAYFISIKDTKQANDAYHIFHYIQNCSSLLLSIS